MPKATKDVKVSLKPKPKPKAQEPKAKRSTKNSNKDKAPELKAKKSTTEKKSKVKKDPNVPKKPLSAYMMYCADMRDEVKKENPGAAFVEITRIIARQWCGLSEDAKAPYHAKNEKAKVQWVIDNKIYHERGAPSTKSLPEDADEEDTGDEDFDF